MADTPHEPFFTIRNFTKNEADLTGIAGLQGQMLWLQNFSNNILTKFDVEIAGDNHECRIYANFKRGYGGARHRAA
jgi:hypothetical protein